MERRLVWWAFAGFVILSLWGVLLRLMQVIPIDSLNYSFILHAHSHFAFSGWIFLSLALLITKTISPQNLKSYNLFFVLTLVCSFGMLVSFSVQGYKAASIIFSTLFIFLGYHFSYKVLRCNKFRHLALFPKLLIKASLIYSCISAAGPFALSVIIATGNKGTPIYHNAIYFYLHFQMNGWMLLCSLGLLANGLKRISISVADEMWLRIFIYSIIPLYLLFVLWTASGLLIHVVAFISAAIHLYSWLKILPVLLSGFKSSILVKTALLAITIRAFLQIFVCFPEVGSWVFSNRNLIIGYVHLLVLGAVMPIILQQFISAHLIKLNAVLKVVNVLFVIWTVVYLISLFVPPILGLFQIIVRQLQMVLLVVAIGFVSLGILYLWAFSKME